MAPLVTVARAKKIKNTNHAEHLDTYTGRFSGKSHKNWGCIILQRIFRTQLLGDQVPTGGQIFGKRNSKNWFLKFDTLNTGVGPLMGWETSKDTMSEVKIEFPSKEQAVKYAKKNNIDYYVVEHQESKIIKKSYTNNFLKDN